MDQISLPTLNVSKEANNWQRWKRGFELFLQATNITDDRRKKALLLSTGGLELQDIYFSLPESDESEEDVKKNCLYTKCLSALDSYFTPKINYTYERYKFRQIKQESDENIEHYVSRLRNQAKYCNFGDFLNDQLCDQIVEHCNSEELRKELLRKSKLTIDEVLKAARCLEALELQQLASKSKEVVIQAIQNRQGSRSKAIRNTTDAFFIEVAEEVETSSGVSDAFSIEVEEEVETSGGDAFFIEVAKEVETSSGVSDAFSIEVAKEVETSSGVSDAFSIEVEEEVETSSGVLIEEEPEVNSLFEVDDIKIENEEEGSSSLVYIKEEEELILDSEVGNANGRLNFGDEEGLQESSGGPKRSYRHKHHFCLFCGKKVVRLARHFMSKHPNEPRYLQAVAAPPKMKKALIQALLKEGDYQYNMRCLEAQDKGAIIAIRKMAEGSDYLPCPNCKGFYARKTIRHHTCSTGDIFCTRKLTEEGNRLVLTKTLPKIKERFISEIIIKLRKDKFYHIIINDDLILQVGVDIFDQKDLIGRDSISTVMRRLAKLLIHMRSHLQTPTLTLTDVIDPSKFDEVMDAIRVVCQEVGKEKRPEINNPSLAIKYSHSLTRCCKVMELSSIKKGDSITQKKASDFKFLLEREYKLRIDEIAQFSLREKRKEGSDVLPRAEDHLLLLNHIRQEMTKLEEELDNNPTHHAFSRLLNYTLASLIIFNKRRSGEASRMTLSQYREMKSWCDIQHNTEYLRSLTVLEKQIGAQMHLIRIIGKYERAVPVLVSNDVRSTLEKLMSFRDYYVDPRNPFFFARPCKGSLEPLRGNDTIRLVVSETQGLQNPEFLKSTNFRKLFSTMMQVMELSSNELEQIKRHLGHNIDVNKDSHFIHEDAAEMAKVGLALVASEAGALAKLRNRPLSSITLEDLTADPSLLTGPVEEEGFTLKDDDTDMIGGDIISVPGPSNISPPRRTEPPDSLILHSSTASSSDDSDIEPPFTTRCRTRRQPLLPTNKTPNKPSKIQWSVDERIAVLNFFKEYLPLQKVPGKVDCNRCIEENPVLSRRQWKDIKNYVHNYLAKVKNNK